MVIGDRFWLDSPPQERMSLAEWQTRLEQTFDRDGMIGETSLLPVFDAERKYGAEVDSRFKGLLVLSDSFQNFLLGTIRLAEDKWRKGDVSGEYNWYGVLLMECGALFRALRAADVLLHSGYPLDGFSLLRDIRDRAVYLSGVGNRLTTLRQLGGFKDNEGSAEPLTAEEWEQMRSRAAFVEREMIRRTIGTGSGLPEATVYELKRWTSLFHMEIHGSRLTRASEFREWITGRSPLPLVPAVRAQSIAVFANRFAEVGWMVLRVLPLLQLTPESFGTEWATRWSILDDSFRHDVEDLWRMGKPIAGAIITMIDTHFVFSPHSSYPA